MPNATQYLLMTSLREATSMFIAGPSFKLTTEILSPMLLGRLSHAGCRTILWCSAKDWMIEEKKNIVLFATTNRQVTCKIRPSHQRWPLISLIRMQVYQLSAAQLYAHCIIHPKIICIYSLLCIQFQITYILTWLCNKPCILPQGPSLVRWPKCWCIHKISTR